MRFNTFVLTFSITITQVMEVFIFHLQYYRISSPQSSSYASHHQYCLSQLSSPSPIIIFFCTLAQVFPSVRVIIIATCVRTGAQESSSTVLYFALLCHSAGSSACQGYTCSLVPKPAKLGPGLFRSLSPARASLPQMDLNLALAVKVMPQKAVAAGLRGCVAGLCVAGLCGALARSHRSQTLRPPPALGDCGSRQDCKSRALSS